MPQLFNQGKDTLIMFIDMNSFFATCEQQVNFYLRGRPVGVCVYTGKYGCVIAPSIEAKAKGVKTGMRLNEAMELCPELVPLETRPARYREFHVKIISILKRYSEEVYPKSIDEAVIDLTNYRLIYKDPFKLARQVKEDIRKEVGDWMKCSIGIAPNAFLAKLACTLKKPDGLVSIFPDNIDEVLKGLQLTQLPGIARGMASRLMLGGINTPLDLRYASPQTLKAACKSIVGLHWHYRLNFQEVDLEFSDYKTMQAMRQVSSEQRRSVDTLEALLVSLCMTLEKRMVRQDVFCTEAYVDIRYEEGYRWSEKINPGNPLQDGMGLHGLIKKRMQRFEELKHSGPLINNQVLAMGVGVSGFIPAEMIQYELFGDNIKKHKLRKTVYDLKDRFGYDKLLKAIELNDEHVMKDAIGFGSVKDLYTHTDEGIVEI